eukprot:6089297-Pleurochrysis_carterae.AAC.3
MPRTAQYQQTSISAKSATAVNHKTARANCDDFAVQRLALGGAVPADGGTLAKKSRSEAYQLIVKHSSCDRFSYVHIANSDARRSDGDAEAAVSYFCRECDG